MTIMALETIEKFKSIPWKNEMAKLGENLKTHNVSRVVFVHGTFAGNDPLGFFNIIQSFNVPPFFITPFKEFSKNVFDSTLDDRGNFTDGYVTSFAKAIDNGISCDPFVWSSENNHICRVLEVPKLARHLAENITKRKTKSDRRILLIGHSHAGQLFALLTIFLEGSDKARALLNVIKDADDFDAQAFDENIEKIAAINLDIVTLGTPVRYSWGNYEKYRLLNIVNHRSDVRIDGLTNTRDGDYIQHWGTEGTDLPSTSPLNRELDELLDKGVGGPKDLQAKLQEVTRRQPLKLGGEKAGETVLVDYQDSGMFSGFENLFGHGAYTRRENMLFNTKLIVDYFYKGDMQ